MFDLREWNNQSLSVTLKESSCYPGFMSNPYRVPDPPVVKPVPKTPLSTRVKDWFSGFPERHPLVMLVLFVLTLSSTCVMCLSLAPPVDNHKVMRSYADRWAGYHHGQVIGCQSTPDNHNYFCRVSTSAGTVKLVYDEAGNSEPFMIVQDTQE